MSLKPVYIIMGVTASGKTTLGKELAKYLSADFFDADAFHPEENIKKMSSGIPLDDKDRLPWLKSINHFFLNNDSGFPSVLACSALKQSYRDLLTIGLDYQFIYLKTSKDLIKERIKNRKGHFMPESLIDSQFEILEEPENALIINSCESLENCIEKILAKLNPPKKEIGLIGMGVMGTNLSRNLARNGFSLSLYNRFYDGLEEKVARHTIENYEELEGSLAFEDMKAFVRSLEKPRKIIMMVSAGKAIDQVIDALIPLLEKGDCIMDGGNAHYKKTASRINKLNKHKILFLGTGISGGQKGALEGPSIMPGGQEKAYNLLAPFLERIAAVDYHGNACCKYIGPGGSGHFVKMAHNGIEYAEMQLIAEVYGLLMKGSKLGNQAISAMFLDWNQGNLASYLLEISAYILKHKDGHAFTIDTILDKAANKGTGSWTTMAASELGIAIPTITSALFARFQSSQKDLRVKAQEKYEFEESFFYPDFDRLKNVYRIARIVNHHQGFELIKEASKVNRWNIDLQELAAVWTNGCIIRSKLMNYISQLNLGEGGLLMQDAAFSVIKAGLADMKKIISDATFSGLPIPCISASYQYLIQFTQEFGTANLIQAQRDYFGAHLYEKLSGPDGIKYHTNWQDNKM